MSDDLMKRLDTLVEDLREGRRCWPHEYISAAVDAMDRIEALEAKLAKLEAAAQKAVGHITGYGEASTARIELRTALAELTGGKDE